MQIIDAHSSHVTEKHYVCRDPADEARLIRDVYINLYGHCVEWPTDERYSEAKDDEAAAMDAFLGCGSDRENDADGDDAETDDELQLEHGAEWASLHNLALLKRGKISNLPPLMGISHDAAAHPLQDCEGQPREESAAQHCEDDACAPQDHVEHVRGPKRTTRASAPSADPQPKKARAVSSEDEAAILKHDALPRVKEDPLSHSEKLFVVASIRRMQQFRGQALKPAELAQILKDGLASGEFVEDPFLGIRARTEQLRTFQSKFFELVAAEEHT